MNRPHRDVADHRVAAVLSGRIISHGQGIAGDRLHLAHGENFSVGIQEGNDVPDRKIRRRHTANRRQARTRQNGRHLADARIGVLGPVVFPQLSQLLGRHRRRKRLGLGHTTADAPRSTGERKNQHSSHTKLVHALHLNQLREFRKLADSVFRRLNWTSPARSDWCISPDRFRIRSMTNITIDPVGIDGVKLAKLTVWEDERGSFFEAFRASWFTEQRQKWVQWNVSRSTGSVVRGLHFHKLQTDYWP